MSSPITIEEANFEAEVMQAKTPVLVDFWAPWCGPCRMVGPVVDELADEYEGKIGFGKINVDEQPKLASQFGVMSIPTLIVFKEGKVHEQVVGFKPKDELKEVLDGAL
jgi:thioredoxin 1